MYVGTCDKRGRKYLPFKRLCNSGHGALLIASANRVIDYKCDRLSSDGFVIMSRCRHRREREREGPRYIRPDSSRRSARSARSIVKLNNGDRGLGAAFQGIDVKRNSPLFEVTSPDEFPRFD